MPVFMALSYEVHHMGILHTPPRINVKNSIQGKCFANFMLYCRKQLASYLIVEYAIFFLYFFKYYVIHATLLVDGRYFAQMQM